MQVHSLFCYRKGKIMIEEMYSIKEAAKELGVEAHALRFWEEELGLEIERNAQGRRVYSEENIKRFREIQKWKAQGLQLKDIKPLIHNEEIFQEEAVSKSRDELGSTRIIMYRPKESSTAEVISKEAADLERSEKSRRLQELLKQFISDSIRESNAEFLETIKEGLLKELDYQFRLQEEREEEREKLRIEMEDEHFKRLDEHLRSAVEKGKRKRSTLFSRK